MDDQTISALDKARAWLEEARRLSGQGSYQRRFPASESLIPYKNAFDILSELVIKEPGNRKALLLLCDSLEGQMEFRRALEFLDRALDRGEPKTKMLLKRKARLKASAEEWEKFPLSPIQLKNLGDFLENSGVGPDNRSVALTEKWLSENYAGAEGDVIEALRHRGASSDFQVLVNVVRG